MRDGVMMVWSETQQGPMLIYSGPALLTAKSEAVIGDLGFSAESEGYLGRHSGKLSYRDHQYTSPHTSRSLSLQGKLA